MRASIRFFTRPPPTAVCMGELVNVPRSPLEYSPAEEPYEDRLLCLCVLTKMAAFHEDDFSWFDLVVFQVENSIAPVESQLGP